MKNDVEYIEKIDKYIRTHYKSDLKKMNGLLCLFKCNIDKIEQINKVEDFDLKFNQAKGYETELLNIINKVKCE